LEKSQPRPELPGESEGSAGRVPLWDATLAWFLLQFFLWNIGMGVFSPLLPQIVDDLRLSFAAAGLLVTAFAVTRFLVDLPAGILADRMGIPHLLHGAAAFLAAGALISAVADSFEVMAIARALTGTGSGLANTIAVLYLMRRGAAAHRNRRANLYEIAVVAGMAISANVAGAIATAWSWRATFGMAAAVLALTWFVAAFGVLPGLRGTPGESAPSPRVARPPGGAVSRGVIFAIFFASFAQAFAWGGGISTLLPLYGGSALHLSSAAIGQAMAVAFWVEVCLLYPAGWAADAWGKVAVMVAGFAASLCGVLLGPFTAGPLGYGIAFALLTAGMSVWMTAPALLAEHLGDRFGGKAAGLYRLVTDFGFILAPATVGWLIQHFGFGAASAVIAAVLAASILLSLVCLRRPSLA
jgi:predicted MFS family arabinose efflux permease